MSLLVNNSCNFPLNESDSDDEEDHYKISDHFKLRKVLGEGMFGKVYSAHSYEIKKEVALKLVDKTEYGPKKLLQIRYEESLISQLNHPNIIQFYMSKETPKFIIMALELAEGQNMKDLFDQNFKFSSDMIRDIMKALLSAVSHIHSKRIVHRDIKPDNIIIQIQENNKYAVKLIDFGLSFQMQGSYFIVETVGTPIFFAPEMILKKPYSHLVDIWSCGLVFYMMFSGGIHPIYTKNLTTEEFNDKTMKFRCDFPATMDKKAIDLFKKMCFFTPEERLDANQALNHPWITGKEEIQFNPLEKIRIFNNLEKIIEILKAIVFINHLYKVSEKPKRIKISIKKRPLSPLSSSKKTTDIRSRKIDITSKKSYDLPSLSAQRSYQKTDNFTFSPENKKKSVNSKGFEVCSQKFIVNSSLDELNLSNYKNYSSKSSLFGKTDSKEKSNEKLPISSRTNNKILDEMLTSTKSCVNSYKIDSEEKLHILPQINKKVSSNVEVDFKRKSNSIGGYPKDERFLPKIQKVSKFKSDKVKN